MNLFNGRYAYQETTQPIYSSVSVYERQVGAPVGYCDRAETLYHSDDRVRGSRNGQRVRLNLLSCQQRLSWSGSGPGSCFWSSRDLDVLRDDLDGFPLPILARFELVWRWLWLSRDLDVLISFVLSTWETGSWFEKPVSYTDRQLNHRMSSLLVKTKFKRSDACSFYFLPIRKPLKSKVCPGIITRMKF